MKRAQANVAEARAALKAAKRAVDRAAAKVETAAASIESRHQGFLPFTEPSSSSAGRS